MTELGLILFGALLVNNLCWRSSWPLPFHGHYPQFRYRTGHRTRHHLRPRLAAVTSHLLYHLLVPLQLAYLNIIVLSSLSPAWCK